MVWRECVSPERLFCTMRVEVSLWVTKRRGNPRRPILQISITNRDCPNMNPLPLRCGTIILYGKGGVDTRANQPKIFVFISVQLPSVKQGLH